MRSTISPQDHRSSASARAGAPGDGPSGAPARSRGGGLAGAVGRLAMATYWLPGLAGAWAPLRGPLGIEDRTASALGWAITFDDGPHPQATPAVLEVLAAHRARATFFLVGEQVLRNPALPAEILAAGHQIGLHCHRHRNLLRLAPWQVREDIARARAAIEDAAGVTPALYRPPYGVLNATALRIARRASWRTLLWSHWGRDWEARATPESIARRLTTDAGEGSVLLLHDADDYGAPGCWRRTVEALPRVLDAMAQGGFEAASP